MRVLIWDCFASKIIGDTFKRGLIQLARIVEAINFLLILSEG